MRHLHDQRGITTFWGVSIILIEVVVVLFVFYILYYFWIENPMPTDGIILVRLFRHSSVRIQSDAQTPVDWLTYQNVTYGFAMRYPAGYTIKEGQIEYNQISGHVVSLMSGDTEALWLRIFPRTVADTTTPIAYRRLTNIDPSIYQTYKQQVSGGEAIVYRVAPGTESQDHVYFMSNDYFFEAPLNAQTAPLLGTLIFIK